MRVAYTAADGSAHIVNAAPKSQIERSLGKLTDKQYRDHVMSRSIPADATDVTELPADWVAPPRDFRNAWKLEGGKIGHDMEKCRAIHKDKLRLARAPLLAALDVEYQRADEADDKAAKADIAKRKQALRDVTAAPEIEAAKTPEELKAVWPL